MGITTIASGCSGDGAVVISSFVQIDPHVLTEVVYPINRVARSGLERFPAIRRRNRNEGRSGNAKEAVALVVDGPIDGTGNANFIVRAVW